MIGSSVTMSVAVSNSQVQLLSSLKLKQVTEQIAKEAQLAGTSVDITDAVVESWQEHLTDQARQSTQVASRRGLEDEGWRIL